MISTLLCRDWPVSFGSILKFGFHRLTLIKNHVTWNAIFFGPSSAITTTGELTYSVRENYKVPLIDVAVFPFQMLENEDLKPQFCAYAHMLSKEG